MSDDSPPLAAFDDDVLAGVAAEVATPVDELRSLVRRHQATVRDLPGVEDIVYEWRSQFHEDPLVYRSPSVYVLAHREHVWAEFGDALELSGDEVVALRAVHDCQARDLVPDGSHGRLETTQPMVLTRP